MAKTLGAGQKAAQTRKRRTSARKAVVTRNRRAGARKAVITRNVVQWGDICKAHFMLTGKVSHFRSIRNELQKRIDAGLIERTETQGEYLFAKLGWSKFQRK